MAGRGCVLGSEGGWHIGKQEFEAKIKKDCEEPRTPAKVPDFLLLEMGASWAQACSQSCLGKGADFPRYCSEAGPLQRPVNARGSSDSA